MTPDDRTRLIRLLGMIGSDHDGECLNAARAAQRLLTTLGYTWQEALDGSGSANQGWTEDQVRRVAEEAHTAGHAAGYQKALDEISAGKPNERRRKDDGWLTWRGLAKDLLEQHDDELTDWERTFCAGFLERGFPTPTVKQQAVFERIALKCEVDCPA